MDFEHGKKWLSRARSIDLEIKDKIYLIEALYTCCGLQGISYDKISVVSSPENKLERIIADINEAQKELEELRHKKEIVIYEIKSKIDKLDNSPEKTILIGFYVACYSMRYIAEDLGYEEHYCYELRKKGILKL